MEIVSLQNQLIDLTHHVAVAERDAEKQIIEDFKRDQAASFQQYEHERRSILSRKRLDNINRLAEFERDRIKVLAEYGVDPATIRPRSRHNPEVVSQQLKEMEIRDEEGDLEGFFGASGSLGGDSEKKDKAEGGALEDERDGLRSAVETPVEKEVDLPAGRSIGGRKEVKGKKKGIVVMDDEDFEEPEVFYGKKGKGRRK
ncbi:hypothetical protein BJ508DRAFT_312066 [Ascobolus immersus RN42]|uniref:Uncharacterized protein n=1 Tax=Ascobolus immersus RN42 TaxID=1160509 RepID=A0A3N4HPZ9_ASCIM|nr:hypothetical protein BJ508DRAFT_312066 [Ascobolus immersus RN42]